jgi:alpha-beta hydrolase superfamily lysophospholipase
MKHSEGSFKGIRDLDIFYQCWLPEDEVKAVLLVVHGLAEHSGRYMNLVNHFVPAGYNVYGLDHPGHGRSAGQRVYVNRFEDYTDTLGIFTQFVLQENPDKPLILIGHSMGGLISALYLIEHQKDFEAAVLSGPLIKTTDNAPPLLAFIGRLLSILMPRAGLVQLEADGVSRDPAVVEAYNKDPLVFTGKITARLGSELLNAVQRINAEASRITLPLLILQGSADRLVHPSGAQILYDKVGSAQKELKMYDGFFHEVFNEPEHEQVMKDIEKWMENYLGDQN